MNNLTGNRVLTGPPAPSSPWRPWAMTRESSSGTISLGRIDVTGQ